MLVSFLRKNISFLLFSRERSIKLTFFSKRPIQTILPDVDLELELDLQLELQHELELDLDLELELELDLDLASS